MRSLARLLAIGLLGLTLAGCGGGQSAPTNTPPANTPATIMAQPANQTIVAGQAATFSVVAAGTPSPTYQWQEDGVNIPNATSPTYTIPNVASTDNNTHFDVIVSNSLQTATSNVVTLTLMSNYYVDASSGLDTNSGVSKNLPWQHAPGMTGCASNCALAVLNPGDQVIFKGNVTWSATSFPWTVGVSGASGNPIYFGIDKTWFAGSAWGRPVFDLNAATWSVAPILANSANFVVIDNLEIKNEAVNDSGGWLPRGSITVSGGSAVTIENCYIHGWSIQNPTSGSDFAPSGGIAFYNGSTGGVVKNCVLDGSAESDSGIAIYGGTTIQNNIIENVPNGIVVNDPGANVSGNQVFNVPYSVDPATSSNAILVNTSGNVYSNIVHDLVPGTSPISLESAMNGAGNTQAVYNNLVWNVGDTSPVIVNSGDMYSNSTSNQSIYGNTLSGGAVAGCINVVQRYYPPTNLTVENNHCISDEPASAAWCWNNAGGNFDCGPVTNLTFTFNILMTTAKTTAEGYISGNSFQPSAANVDTVGAGLNLSLNCGSIGVSLCSDLLGVLRPGSVSAWDVGAYQYQATSHVLPVITAPPVHQEVLQGQTATFTVIAAGSPALIYQWLRNGANIQGATSPIYTTPLTSISDDGTLFSVLVTNASGSVTSSPAALSVNSVPGALIASTPYVAFGNLTVDTVAESSLTLTNSSNSYATISNVTISGTGLNASGVPIGLILAPGEATTLNLVFLPTSVGNVLGNVAISSDAAGSPLTIPLSGSGLSPAHLVNLTWNPMGSPVFGYYVYRAIDQSGPYTLLNSTPIILSQFTDSTVVPGQTYMYWVTSVDSNTSQSPFSDSVIIAIPTP